MTSDQSHPDRTAPSTDRTSDATDGDSTHDPTDRARVQPATRVPQEATAADVFECPYCDRPFPRGQLHDLHLGEEHEGELNDEEREAYEDARDDEGDDLFVFHLQVIGGIVALYAVMIILYMVVLGYQG